MSAWQQHYDPQTINMMAYNGAEKGCSGTKEELVMELMALPDGDDVYPGTSQEKKSLPSSGATASRTTGGRVVRTIWYIYSRTGG